MSASQQARNKKLHEQIERLKSELVFSNKTVEVNERLVNDLQDKVNQLNAENSRLLHMMPEAFYAGAHARIAYGSEHMDKSCTGWLKQKGLT